MSCSVPGCTKHRKSASAVISRALTLAHVIVELLDRRRRRRRVMCRFGACDLLTTVGLSYSPAEWIERPASCVAAVNAEPKLREASVPASFGNSFSFTNNRTRRSVNFTVEIFLMSENSPVYDPPASVVEAPASGLSVVTPIDESRSPAADGLLYALALFSANERKSPLTGGRRRRRVRRL